MQGVINIEDLRKLAKKRLPRIAYDDFIEGGTDDEVGPATNEQAFRQARIVPRYLVDVAARTLGVDGIRVSNHGARQLDNAPSPLQAMSAIRDAVGDKMTLMLDGGIRRGLDTLNTLCAGAKFCFVGRPAPHPENSPARRCAAVSTAE